MTQGLTDFLNIALPIFSLLSILFFGWFLNKTKAKFVKEVKKEFSLSQKGLAFIELPKYKYTIMK
jgi:hypothetical protein